MGRMSTLWHQDEDIVTLAQGHCATCAVTVHEKVVTRCMRTLWHIQEDIVAGMYLVEWYYLSTGLVSPNWKDTGPELIDYSNLGEIILVWRTSRYFNSLILQILTWCGRVDNCFNYIPVLVAGTGTLWKGHEDVMTSTWANYDKV